MKSQKRSSASNTKSVQGATGGFGTPPTTDVQIYKPTFHTYIYIDYDGYDEVYPPSCSYVSDFTRCSSMRNPDIRRLYEIYTNGSVYVNPFEVLMWDDLEGDITPLWNRSFGVNVDVPNFDASMLLDIYPYKMFLLNGTYYMRYYDRIHVCEYEGYCEELWWYKVLYRSYSISEFMFVEQYAVVELAIWFTERLRPQSGLEECGDDIDIDYKYGKSKRRTRWKNKGKLANRLKAVTEQLEYANLGSRKKDTKKKFAKKLKTNHVSGSVNPQSGTELNVPGVLEILEKVIGLFLMKYSNHPIFTGLSALLLMFKSSISLTLYETLERLIAGFDKSEATLSNFSNWLKDLVTNVEKFKSNKFATNFMEFIIKCWTTFLCPSILTEWTEKTMKGTVKKIFSFFAELNNPLESIIWSITYVVNAIDVFIKDGTFEGFLVTQTTTDELLNRLRDLRSDFKLYYTGDLEFIKGHKQYSFLVRLDAFLKDLIKVRKSKRGLDLKILDDWVKEVDSMVVECQRVEAHSGARMQPYMYLITSGSGISKTHLLQLFASTIARANNIPFGREYIHFVNQGNKFQSGWKNFVTTWLIDDSAALHAEQASQYLCLADWVLRASNNFPHELLGADLKDKGTLFNRALIGGWASNSFSQDFESYARFSSAINRRFQARIIGKVKPQYIQRNSDGTSVSTRIDYSKLSEEDRNSIAPDAWLFDVRQCDIADTGIQIKTEFTQPVREFDSNFCFPIAKDENGKLMENRSLEDTLKYLVWHSRQHYASQASVLRVNEKLYDSDSFCKHGLPKQTRCAECDVESECKELPPLETIEEEDEELLEERRLDTITHMDALLGTIIEAPTPLASQMPPAIEELSSMLGPIPELPKLDPEELVDHNIEKQEVVTFSEEWVRNPNRVDETSMPALLKLKSKISYNWDALDSIFCRDFLESALRCQSGTEKRIIYCKKLLDVLKTMRIENIDGKFRDTISLINSMRSVCQSVKTVLQGWFTGLVCDIVSYLCDRLFDYIERFINNPLEFIPVSLEGTMLAHYAYSKHPLLRVGMMADYIKYRCNYSILNFGKHPDEHVIDFSTSMYVYNNFIRDPTPEEQNLKDVVEPMSFSKFVKKAVVRVSNLEKERKSQHPDLIRDVLVPLGITYTTILTFIPTIVEQFSGLYCEVQVGYDMSIEEIHTKDNLVKQEWYKNKQEVFLSKPSVECNRSCSELENAIKRNLFYVRNPSTKEIVSALSFANQYVILPYHFAKKSIGNVLQFLKTEVPSYECCGNAIVEVQLCSDNLYKLPGDACVMYLEKSMDHLRTKDLLSSFPKDPIVDKCVGRLLYRHTRGVYHTLETRDIIYGDSVTNNSPYDTVFKGYKYYCKNFMGLCGAVLIDETRKVSSILGIHVGGNVDTQQSVAAIILRDDLERAIDHFTGGVLLQSGFDLNSTLLKGYSPEIYKKNPFLDTLDRLDGVQLLGSAKTRYSYNNKVIYTDICEDVKKEFNVDYEFVAPPFKFNDDKRHGVRQLIRAYGRKNIVKDVGLVRKAHKDLLDSFLHPLLYGENKDTWQSEIRLLNDFEVVNGVLGKRFLGGMNMSSAFGGGFVGSKSNFAMQNADNTWKFEDWVMDRVFQYEDMMDQGTIVPDIVVQQLKLEATPLEKASIGKVRSFFMSSTFIQIVLRRLLLTTCRYACLNTKHTEIVVGINAHSTDWTRFIMEVTKFGKNRMVALDLTNMDATVMFEVLSGCIDIFFSPFNMVCNKDGRYTKRLMVLKNMLLFPLIDVHGDLVCMSGLLPSGTPLTSMLGCLINSTYYRMAFYYLYSGPKVFTDLVTLRVYGDDSLANVSREADFFTVRNVLKAWNSVGILGTDMEKKGDKSNKRFYCLDEVEFLKRRFVYQKDFGVVVAPLSKKSMFKCIMCHVPPRTVTLKFLTGQCIDNFLFEAKFHGRQYYEESRRRLRNIAIKHDLLRFCNLLEISYSEMVKQWKVDNDDCVLVTEQWGKCQSLWFRLAQKFNFDIQNWSEWTQNTNENNFIDENQRVIKLGVALDEAQVTTQSGVEYEEEQVVTFVQTEEPMTIDMSGPTTDKRLLSDKAFLQDFFKRPVLIKTVQWGATPIYTDIDPWVALLENPRIQNRMNNYNLFRARCHVKFLVNGNGFFYGRMMASYLPFTTYSTGRPVSALGQDDLLVPISQYPRIFIDPATSGGAEMVLPFFYPYPYICLTDNIDFRRLGTIYFNTVVPLRHASQDLVATGERVTISVYAWFDNVELEGPTAKDMTNLTPQSGREEESVDKPISQTATNVANVASNLTTIPVIAPYALAVEKAAKLTSTIASALGYCKPVAVAEPNLVIPRPLGTLAVTNTSSSAVKLSLDVKQETSISPMDVNLSGRDELSFNYIAQKDSYLNQFEWPLSAASGTLLQSYAVSPWLYRTGTTATTRISMTAICGVANCFTHWTGSIVFRFQIVKSAFHRGRLCVIYDPKLTRLNREENINFSHVIDIGETSDFEITIGNYQDREWLFDSSGSVTPWYTKTVRSADPLSAGGNLDTGRNGVISIYVVNELTAPSAVVANDITMACYVRAGPDFQVANPYTVGGWQTVQPQSGMEEGAGLMDADTVGVGMRRMKHASSLNPNINKLYIGEVVTNFRTLLKRDSYYSTIVDSNISILDYFKHPMYPYYPQLQNNFPIAAARNKCAMTMLNYVMLAFAGYKGATRWKITTLCSNTNEVFIARDESTIEFTRGSIAYVDESSFNASLKDIVGNDVMRGALLTMSSINPVVEFEMPFYSSSKFFISDTDMPPFTVFHPQNHLFTYTLMKTTVATEVRNVINMFVSGGEDFTCYFFLGWPPVYVGV